jgi:hypothetical protein
LELVQSIELLWAEEQKEVEAERVAEEEAELERRADARFPGATDIGWQFERFKEQTDK